VNIIDKRSFSKKFDEQMNFLVQRQRNANVEQTKNPQPQNVNAFEVLKKKTSFRLKKDRLSLNLNVTFIENTQKNKL
jgi:hypothetical protein